MSDDHQDDLYENLDEYREEDERQILYRLDERTERMDSRIERMAGRSDVQNKRLDEQDDRIQRNTTILNAMTFGLGAILTSGVAKLQGLIKF